MPAQTPSRRAASDWNQVERVPGEVNLCRLHWDNADFMAWTGESTQKNVTF